MKLFLPKCLGITLLCCLYSIFLSAQTGPAGVNSGTVLWLDASDVNAGGAAPAIGSTVSSWKDKSGSNHNATSSGANTATYINGGANSTPVIHFNRSSSTSGTGFTVSGVDIRATTSPVVTIFAVYRQGTNDGNNQAVWGNDNGSLQRFFNSKWSTGTTEGSLSTGGTAAVVAGASTVGETKVVTGIYSGLVTSGVNTGANNASAVYINGKKLSTFTDMTAASSGQSVFKIGSDGDDNYFNGDVSEIIVYNRKLTDCELETVNRYLADKYATDFINIGANYTLGVPVNRDINGVGKPASACGGNYTVVTASSDIVMVTNPSSTSTSGVVLTFANDRKGYASSSETPPAYSSRLTQMWRADLNGNIGTVDICFNLQNLGIDVSNSGNFALLIDKDGNFSDATPISSGVTIFIDRVCISNVSITKGDYFTLAIRASTSDASSITSPNKGIFQKANFRLATVIDNQIQVKGNDTITNGRAYIDSNFVSGDVLAFTAGALPAGVTGAYNATTGAISFTGKATAAQWQTIFRSVTFNTTSTTDSLTDRRIRFVLGNVISYTIGSTPHYYEYVTTPMNWVNAKAAAAARTLYGLQGYLATSTSQIENDFLKARLSSDGWVGASCNLAQVNSVSATQYASQTDVDGRYYWITGPEAGQPISTGLTNPVAVGSAYTYWNGGEPNNYNGTSEQYVQLYSTNAGRWNDLPLSSLLGYVVEYGGYASDAVINIEYQRIVRSSPAAPVITGITTDSNINGDRITNDSTLLFAGTSPKNAKVTILREDLGVIGNVTASGTGTWTFDYTGTKLTDGTYNFTAIDTVATVESAMSVIFQVTIDRTAPAKPAKPELVPAGSYINTQLPTFTGSAEPGSTVTLLDGTNSRGTAKADSTGKWIITATSMTTGAHSVTVKATDIAGNVSVASDILAMTIDLVPPAAPATPVLTGGIAGGISNSNPTITGTGAEPNTTVLIIKNGIVIDSVKANASGAYTYTFATALPDTIYNITVKDRDMAGTLSTASPILTITVDTTPPATPTAPVLTGGNNGVISTHKPTITGTGVEANSTVIIFKDGVAIDSVIANASGAYTYTFVTSLPDAVYNITVKAKDAVGNVSAMSPALNLTIDTTVPAKPAAPVLVGGNNGVTSNNTPTITGVAEANSLVIIYRGGIIVDSVMASPVGNYTYTFNTLADGTYSIAVKVKDAAGNVSAFSPVLSITVDTSAPATPTAPVLTDGINGVIGDPRPTITGSAEANSTVIIFQDGVAVDSVIADIIGDYTYTFNTLADAIYSITVKAKDNAGNVSAESPALSITVDTTVPATPAAPVLVGGVNGLISDNTPTITGVAEANSTILIYRDGIAVDAVPVDAIGNYTYTFTTLADGTYSITVKDRDVAGNVSAASPALSIKIDTTVPLTPTAPVLVGGVNGKISDATPAITGSGVEANSTVIIYKDGVAVDSVTADVSGDYTYTFTTLADATYSITVKNKDAAGNVSAASPALSITVDTTAPATPDAPVLVDGVNGVISDHTPSITGEAEANSTVIIFKDGVAVDSVTADASGDYAYTFTTLADGTYSITVKAKDAVGNVSAASPALSITVDTTPPATPAAPVLTGGVNGVISDNTPTITGVAEANSTVIIYKGGVAVDSVTADAGGDYTYTFDPIADGTYSITVKAKDAVDNVSAASPALSITVDTAPPVTPAAPVLTGGNNGVINDNTPTITGVAEANSTVIIYKDGVVIDSVTTNASGAYTYTFVTALADGTYSITVKNKDLAGNVSAMSPALSIKVDTAVPTTPSAPVLVGGVNGVISDHTPSITGQAEANSTVIIFKDGIAVDSVTADASGDYTYTFAALADGTYSITVKAKDAAGNLSAASPALSITVDTTPPTTPAAPLLVGGNNGVINDNTPTIEGAAEANSTVIIFKGGVALDSVTADVNGDYTYTFVTPLTDGIYSIRVKDKDAAGNVSALSTALSITIDTKAPVTPAAPVLVGGVNGVINNNKPTIKGIAEANSTVIILNGDVAIDSVTADAGGNYTYTFVTALADSTYSITVKNKDAAGNVSAASPALSITVDTKTPVTPSAPVLVGGVNGVINDNTPTIEGVAEANSTVIIYKDGVAIDSVTADASGNYTYTFTTLADNTYSITVKDKDAAGNVSAMSPALSITVDTTVPVTPAAPVLVGGNNGVINDNTPSIKGVAEANSTVIIYKDGVAIDSVTANATGDYTYTFVTALADGTYSITVKDKDAAGNVSAMSAALSITVDTVIPATPTAPVLVGGTNGVTNDATPDIKGKAEANSTVTIYNDGVSVGTVIADASGNYTYTFTTALTDTTHAITVTATDKAGNVSPVSPALDIIVDSHGPATPPAPILVSGNNNVTTDPTPDIRGTAEANSKVIIYENGVAVGHTIADGTGAYTFTFLAELMDGQHAITVTATDATDNVSDVSPALNIVVDAHAPARPAAPVLVNSADSVTNDATPDIKGKAEAKTTITIYSDQVSVGTATADASGNYTFTFTTDLMDGQHAITVTATDSVGNVSPVSAALNLLIDTHAPGRPTAPVLVGGKDGLINDATPDISGKAEPNSTVNIFVDGTAAGTAPVDASGNYTFTFPAAIADGPHAITATATDKAGNTSENQSPALNIVIDTKPPSTPSTPILVDGINGVIKTTKPTVTGTVEPNTTVIIYDGDVAVGTTTSDNTGKWIYTFDPGITNGAHTVTVTATDAAGNISAKSAELPITVDAHVPDVPLPPRLPGVNGFVNTATPTLAGQGEPGTLITIYTDGSKSGTALVDANGNWTYTYSPPLLESEHNINVTASEADGANESGHSATVKLTIDLVGPTVKAVFNSNADVVGTVSVIVTFSEGVSGFSWDDVIVTNGKVSGFTQVSSGIYQILITPTANGTVTVSIPAESGFDLIGNGNSASALLSMNLKPVVGIDQVFPMPATNVINVRLTGVEDEQAVIKMTNMAGQVLVHQQNVIKDGIVKVDVQRVPSGTYVLLVVLQKGSYNTTVIIAR